jgi:hypothetical protein
LDFMSDSMRSIVSLALCTLGIVIKPLPFIAVTPYPHAG